MCGRYALALPPAQIVRMLHGYNLPTYEAPDDDEARQTYNFAPGYQGIVYRATRTDEVSEQIDDEQPADEDREHGTDSNEQSNSGSARQDEEVEVRYKLQVMKWGLIPFWTKRSPDYGSMMRTINCRDDSLYEDRGMWTPMKKRKRCIVLAQGFYEWLKKNNGRDRLPHFVKRKDDKLMLFAGLWDAVRYEDSTQTLYTYTIITTDVSKQLSFLHDRMPVIFDNDNLDAIRTWLDPYQVNWSKELQSLLKPCEDGLEVYQVNKDVGKVGNNSPSFIIPLDSKENKNNIANFFGSHKKTAEQSPQKAENSEQPAIKVEDDDDSREIVHDNSLEGNAPKPVPTSDNKISRGTKRELDEGTADQPTAAKQNASPTRPSPAKAAKKMRSATSNGNFAKSPPKPTAAGNQKITSFFGK